MEYFTESASVGDGSSKPEVVVGIFVQRIFNKTILLRVQGIFVGYRGRVHGRCNGDHIFIWQQAKMLLPELSAKGDSEATGIPLCAVESLVCATFLFSYNMKHRLRALHSYVI
jgi:hypothetical protein